MEKKLSRNRARLSIVLMVLALVVIVLTYRYVFGVLAGILLLGAGYAVQFFGLRCPACKKGYAAPQWKGNGTQRCTKCGHYFVFDK